VGLAGITPYRDQQWTEPQARNVTMKDWDFLGTLSANGCTMATASSIRCLAR
jgi:hypothetical protein